MSGRSGRIAARGGIPAALAMVAAAALSGCSDGDAKALTTVTGARDAVLLAADGGVRPLSVGQRLRSGAVVRTGRAGAATFDTDGRQAYLGGGSTYVVGDGRSAELRNGALVVDGRSGPRVTLAAGPLSVRPGPASVVRVERGYALRVGVLAGAAQVRPEVGRSVDVPAYRQVLLSGRRLPSRPTALVLTGDAAERRVVPDLVADDELLQRTATALTGGPAGRALLDAARRRGYVLDAQRGSATGPLPHPLVVALARAAAGEQPASVGAAIRVVEQLRDEGGSWGVVARLVGTSGGRASQAIDALLGSAGAPGATPPGGSAPGPGGSAEPSNPPGDGTRPSPRPSDPVNRPSPSPTGSPTPGPGPSPGPVPSPPTLVDLVDEVLGDANEKLAPSPGGRLLGR